MEKTGFLWPLHMISYVTKKLEEPTLQPYDYGSLDADIQR